MNEYLRILLMHGCLCILFFIAYSLFEITQVEYKSENLLVTKDCFKNDNYFWKKVYYVNGNSDIDDYPVALFRFDDSLCEKISHIGYNGEWHEVK